MNMRWKMILDGRYYISDQGQIKSVPRRKTPGGILKLSINTSGRRYLKVVINGKDKNLLVHRLVAQEFIPNPANLPFVNHKNNNPLDNQAINLEWCTQRYNLNHAARQGRMAHGEKQGSSKLKDRQVMRIRARYKTGDYTTRQLAKDYGVSQRTICVIINRLGWTHLT